MLGNGLFAYACYAVFRYKLLSIDEVWHFATKRKGLFADYVNCFLMLKILASGPPSSCIVDGVVDDAKLDTYVSDVLTKEGITLDKSKIAYNAGLRAIAKLCLNSFWGKVKFNK